MKKNRRPRLSGRTSSERVTPETGIGSLGKVKIGKKAVSQRTGKEYPTSTDYFIFDSPYSPIIDKVLGPRPNRLVIFFISPEPSFSCYDRYELRDSKGALYAYSDSLEDEANIVISKGSTFEIVTEEEKAKRGGGKAFLKAAKGYTKTDWKRKLTIRFMLVELPGLIGYFELTTGGESTSIPNLIGGFDMVYQNMEEGSPGIVPFDLNIAKARSDRSGDSRTYPVLNLVPNRLEETFNKLSLFTKQANTSWTPLLGSGE